MQASIDGYFILPNTINNYLVGALKQDAPSTEHPEFEKAEKEVAQHINRLLAVKGDKTVDHFHRDLGKVMWQECAMSRSKEGLIKAITQIQNIKSFWNEVNVMGSHQEMNTELEKALRLADFMELGLLMCTDALSAKNLVAPILGKNTKPRKEKRCAMMKHTPMYLLGNITKEILNSTKNC